jgi:hypothetical protein
MAAIAPKNKSIRPYQIVLSSKMSKQPIEQTEQT